MILATLSNALILDKPSFVSTHTPDGGMTEGFLEMAQRLLQIPLWAVHRLDRDTSGCLLVTTRAEAVAEYTQTLKTGKKKYTFISPNDSEKSVWSVEGRIEKVASHVFGMVSGESNSQTTFAKIGAVPLGFLYEAEISTGKTHQIRIHAKESEIPVLGDTVYGDTHFARIMLHAKELELNGKKHISPLPTLFQAEPRKKQDLYKFIASLNRRRFLFQYQKDGEGTNAWRLVHREWSGINEPKLCIERLGDVLQFLNYSKTELDTEFIEEVTQIAQGKHWFVREMHNRGKENQENNIQKTSKEMPIQWQITENKIKFDLRHNHGLSSGIFLDQRENRNRVLHSAQGKRVANFFSYTCGFSVAAALGGAHELVSVDTSAVTIEWGKNNFLLNGIDPQKYEFFVADSLFFLGSCLKRKRQFDMIILDPPTFSRHKLGTFKISENLPELLDLAFQCLAPQGELLISLNDELMTTDQLALTIESSVQRTIQKSVRLEKIIPPYDFEFPLERDKVLKGFWVFI